MDIYIHKIIRQFPKKALRMKALLMIILKDY